MNSNDEILNRGREWDLLGTSPFPLSAHSVHTHSFPFPLHTWSSTSQDI